MEDKFLYLDNAATTPLAPEVKKELRRIMDAEVFGNPSSVHKKGYEAALEIEKARAIIARHLSAKDDQIHFVSCGTEANNWVLKKALHSSANGEMPRRILVSAVEHSSVLGVAKELQQQGWTLGIVPVAGDGLVKVDVLEEQILKFGGNCLLSVQHANQETGVIQPIREIAAIAKRHSILFHVDACQSFMKTELSLKEISADFVTISAHKIHGPKGGAALFIRDRQQIDALLKGGAQEGGVRAGTQNLLSIVGFAAAVQAFSREDAVRLKALKRHLILKIQQADQGVQVIGSDDAVGSVLMLHVEGVDARTLAQYLNKQNIYVSVGSACNAIHRTPSPVLLAMGMKPEDASRCLRISPNKWQSNDDMDYFVEHFMQSIDRLRRKECN